VSSFEEEEDGRRVEREEAAEAEEEEAAGEEEEGGAEWMPWMARSTSARKCCCFPMTLPGRAMRSHPMVSRARHECVDMIQSPMSVPVRPSPARQ
jgi:hypothetical protein